MILTIDEARQYYADVEAVHDFDHVLRVLALAERIGTAERADMDVVRTATLLHDTHRVQEDTSGGDHAAMAAAHAHTVLAGRAAPEFIEAVAHAIHAHRFRNDTAPQTIEAKVVFDADKLDAIGAVGVARAFSYGGVHGQRLWAEVPDDYAEGAFEAAHTPHHEFRAKLVHLKDRLYTPTGRALAEARHRFMVAFYARMADEIAGQA
jgi:uncharacterized protein